MHKSIVLSAIVSMVLALPLFSQSDYEYNITRHRGNKIVLLGKWSAADTVKWKQIIDSDGIYEHGFVLLERSALLFSRDDNYFGVKDIDAFENWFRQRYGLSFSPKWAALDVGNKLIVSGVQTPKAIEFDRMLEQRGIRSPLRQVRDFLKENPDHLDAMTDLLKEVHRRALHIMPPNITEDLDSETDLRTWAVMAAETDRVFNSSWLGIELNFFRPDKGQPERFSKLMRNVFRKHIQKVESAISLEPTNITLWNIWAWMARGLPDYKWDSFINSFEPTVFLTQQPWLLPVTIPSSEVSVWAVDQARTKSDWDFVIKFARVAKYLSAYPGETKTEWLPMSPLMLGLSPEPIEGYPVKSAYVPYLEALLKLGDIDGANELYDEMLRFRGAEGNADLAAAVAKSVGMEDLVRLWKKGEQINKVPFATIGAATGGYPGFAVYNANSGDYLMQFVSLAKTLCLNTMVILLGEQGLSNLGWNKEDGARWALFAKDGRILTQDSDIPDLEAMRKILNRFDIKTNLELYREYIAEHGTVPGIELRLVFEFFLKNVIENITPKDDFNDEDIWGESSRILNRVIRENPDVLINLQDISLFNAHFTFSGTSIQSELLKSISGPILTNIESFLERKPSSAALWAQWIFWKKIEGNERSLELLVDRVKLSPLSQAGTVPPPFVINDYCEECKKSGNWNKVIGLLKNTWERELLKIDQDASSHIPSPITKDNLGDRLGILLIEAYLNDNKAKEADDIFNALLNFGGKITNITKIVELAKEKGYERLAKEWENKANRLQAKS